MANVTYVVKKGDTLSTIASAYNTTVDKIVELNALPNKNYIVVGQTLIVSGTKTSVKKNTTSKAKILTFGLQSNTDRTIYASWSWDKSNTKEYQTRWYYDTGDGVWFEGNFGTTTSKQSTYSAPENAKRIKFTVRPVSKTRKVRGKDTSYWTASWSTTQTYDFVNNPPTTPPVPEVTLVDYRLTAKLENLDVNGTAIQFKVVQDDTTVFKLSNTTIKTETNSAQYACIVTPGSSYKVACRAVRATLYSDWSEFSAAVYTIPSAPSGFTVCRANSETSVYLAWEPVNTATSYDIEYATKKEYFDGSNATTTVNDIKFTHYEITGMETGHEYFFRFRAKNDKAEGESGWSDISSVTIGDVPSAPTTWSSTTTAIVGEPLNLYWVHNSKDGSSQTYAELEIIVGSNGTIYEIKNSEDEDEKDKTSVYIIDTSAFVEGTAIRWRVRTSGVMVKNYGDWSIERVVNIYAQPTLSMDITDVKGNSVEEITAFPFYIPMLAGPSSQTPIGHHLVVTANEMYETVDDIGNTKVVVQGQEVYSKYFDVMLSPTIEFSANNIDLENNVSYTVTGTVTMNSGLTASNSRTFSVSWTDQEYEPNAEIGIDYETLTAWIRPYCEDEDGVLIEDLYLSVYRREFDGTFTELIKNVENSESLFITDPHPALDYARYRVVAIDKLTGAVSYCDIAGYPVGETSIVMQWNEAWDTFDTTNSDEMEDKPYSGSLLKLPYNVDVSDSHSSDVSMVEYIGRKRPVTYYGTQLGHTSTWNVTIPKEDKETLYALRRLAIWMGDVYVREPSGSGYWANVKVSFSQKHQEVTIPVTLNITRVEGGA